MVNQANLIGQFSVGSTDLSALRRSARDNSPDGLKAVAQQFEALLVNMMLKSMRDATPKNGLFDSEQTRLYTSLLDQQISQNFAKRGIGLADALLRQLSPTQSAPLPSDKSVSKTGIDGAHLALSDSVKQQQISTLAKLSLLGSNGSAMTGSLNGPSGNLPTNPLTLSDDLRSAFTDSLRGRNGQWSSKIATGSAATLNQPTSKPAHVRAFQEKLGVHADEASRATGIPAKFMLGQAALESGWGKRVMVAADGTSSHNLFGIKATKGWAGKVVETTTTEYVDGVAYRKKEKFRAYDSYADSFKDYARLLKSSPRYKNVLANSHDAVSFAQGLQRAGYATDPHYAAKLTRIIQKSLSA